MPVAADAGQTDLRNTLMLCDIRDTMPYEYALSNACYIAGGSNLVNDSFMRTYGCCLRGAAKHEGEMPIAALLLPWAFLAGLLMQPYADASAQELL